MNRLRCLFIIRQAAAKGRVRSDMGLSKEDGDAM